MKKKGLMLEKLSTMGLFKAKDALKMEQER